MDYFIGIDIGTGSIKAVAIDLSGEPLHTTQAGYPTISPEPTYSEQDPELIWQGFVKSLVDLVNHFGTKPRGIALSSAMHSVIPVDEQGNPLMNMIIWADNRSSAVARSLVETKLGEKIYAETGTPIHAMTPVCKIQWLRENQRDLFNKAHKFISIKEFVWYKLFGVFETDYSIASATGLLDIKKLTWHTDALEYCGLSPEKLSIPVEVTHSRNELKNDASAQLSILAKTTFVMGGSDGCMANLGSFAISPGVAALTIGTSGAIRVANTKPTINFQAMTFNYLLNKDIFISGGPINNGGVILKWYAEVFLEKPLNTSADYDAILNEIAHIKPGAEGLIFIPYLLGERAPVWNSEASGIFFGIRNFHTQAHFTRAVVEGVSMALYSIGVAMESSGLSIEQINVSGGFVRSEEWLQILADIFDRKIFLINAEDASAVGAAYLGCKSMLLIKDYTDLKPKQDASYKPNKNNHAIYNKVFSVYERLYKKLQPEMEALVELR